MSRKLFWKKPAVITIDILTQYKHKSQNILNENHSIDANKHETLPKRLLLPSSITKSHDEESISAKLRELRNKETKLKKTRGNTQNKRKISNWANEK